LPRVLGRLTHGAKGIEMENPLGYYAHHGAMTAAGPHRAELQTLPREIGAGTVLFLGLVFGVLLWHIAGPVGGDGLFHLARVRKLLDFGSLSLRSVDEFRDGGLHPGYAFPLWHAWLALVDVTFAEGPDESYAIPLVLGADASAGPSTLSLTLELDGARVRATDAFDHPGFCLGLLTGFERQSILSTVRGGSVRFVRTDRFPPLGSARARRGVRSLCPWQ